MVPHKKTKMQLGGRGDPGAAAHEPFPIVGIGASAGGLDAFKTFFTHMPADSGMAFVLVQHLDPTHESLTADLLGRHTAMEVVEIQDRIPVEVNHVYMIPPNKYLTIQDSVLHLSEPVLRRGMRMPIDYFFRSLAEVQRDNAIGIILSGTGSDGTLGLKAIKGEGGIALAQEPETAQYDGMPRSAIATALVDCVAPIEEMPEFLIRYSEHDFVKRTRAVTELTDEEPDRLRSILAVLRTRTKYDFRCYKKGTLMRRIGRRMGLNRIEELGDYLNFLREDSEEATQLFKDLLIGVTGFFREAEAFKVLEEVIGKIVQEKSSESPIRVWIPGCATGEEAYSIAMLITEQLQIAEKSCPLQLFATDIDEEALSVARAGLYPENIAADVSHERLRHFFKKEDGWYRVSKPTRDSVVFAVQNLIADPPFSKLDLISCRNLLIYLETDVQKQLVDLFHFALNEHGYLFLGSAETIGQKEDLFRPVVKKWRLFRRVGTVRPNVVEFPVFPARHQPGEVQSVEPPLLADPVRVGDFTRGLLTTYFAPASVLINSKYQILYYYGPTGHYLNQPTGTPTDDLLVRIRDGLRTKLRALLHKVAQSKGEKETGVAYLRRNGGSERVKITVIPVKEAKGIEGLNLVSFEEAPEPELSEEGVADEALVGGEETLLRQLEHELQATRDDLQSTIEEMESSNEELKAANEEVMSVNEELQSTNEELETSKEELQSLNEELSTVNNQLEDKLGELEHTNDDLTNLLSSTDIATIFLDTEFRIKRFTPATSRLFNLIATDVGRPISDISGNVRDDDLLADARTVLERLTPLEKEVEAEDGKRRHFSRRILPYRTQDNRINGVVVTFVDISERKRAAEHFRMVVEAAPNAALVVNQAGEVVFSNARTKQFFGYECEELIGQPIEQLVPDRLRTQHRAHRQLFFSHPEVRLLGTDREFFAQRKDGGELPVEIGLNPIETLEGLLVLCTIVDISDRKRAEQAMRQARDEAERANRAKSRFLSAASHDLRQPLHSLRLLNDVLAKRVDDPEIVKLIERQGRALSSMKELLNTLLDLNKLESGDIEPQICSFPVTDLFDRLEVEFRVQARERDLNLRIRPCKAIIRSDPKLLDRILQNLISNAIKYTRAGKVLVGCRRRKSGLRIEVWDSGVGIPSDKLKAIFEEYVQLDNPAREFGKGVGLGLSITRNLASILGYQLDVRSTAGKGSMFAIEVPLAAEQHPMRPSSAPKSSMTRYTGPAGASVLLVEDDPAVQDATSVLLNLLGLKVVAVATGGEALSVLQTGEARPDAIIADFRLPDLSGVDVIRQIRQWAKHDIPAVLVTGDTSSESIGEMESRDIEVLHKPSDADKLITFLNQSIKN